MIEIKFRIRLKKIEAGEIIVITNEIFNKNNGFAFFEINKDKYELLSTDQYTGLKDKNGKEIYEGDIVKIHNYETKWKWLEPNFDWRIFKVEWNIMTWSFNNDVLYIPLSDYNERTIEPLDIEIIGNIYENPNLLINK